MGDGSSKEVEKLFNRFDGNHDGKISAAELGKTVRALGAEVSEQEVQVMIQEMDSNRDGYVDMKEFAKFQDGEVLDEELKAAFDMYDSNGDGRISARELQLVLKNLGEECSVEDCARKMKRVDPDGDGYLSFEEFKTLRGHVEA